MHGSEAGSRRRGGGRRHPCHRPTAPGLILAGLIAAGTLLGADGASAQSFPVGEAALRFEDSGSGPPVVLVPGWTQTLETWDFQVPALAEAFRVLRYDRGPWGAQTDPVDLSALLDHLQPGRVALVGHSLGAAAALRFALAHPERVAALVVFGPPAAPGMDPWSDDDTWEAHLTRLGVEPPNPYLIAERHGVDSLLALARGHPLFRIPDATPGTRRLLDRIWERYDGSDLQATDHTPVTRPVTEEALRELRVPTLIIVGEQELAHFRRSAERLRELIPDAELAVVPGGGHMVHMVEPGPFTKALLEFFESHWR